ncbi:MAG TPA: serine hydrolase domain-containing protein [Terriglobales bacterium]|nr:serine hydrolase domain-containing protein [Terriglobales bacterium]
MSDLPQAHAFEVEGGHDVCTVRRVPGYSGREAIAVLARDIHERAFPGASFGVLHLGKIVLRAALGRFTYEEDSPEIELDTIFDLASLTKVVATTAMAMLLYQDGQLDLQQPLVEVLPEFRGNDARRERVTMEMLLAHSSGLPAYVRLFEQTANAKKLFEAALRVPLEADPDTRAEYSDIGFILLGKALERLAGTGLSEFCTRRVYGPLQMTATFFCPSPESHASIPPTVNDQSFRHRVIQGEVHDENASVLGGVAGHAGLFSNVRDLMTFSAEMLAPGSVFRPETIAIFTKRQGAPAGTSRALGWDTPSAPSQSGQFFSMRSYGHLGYTGTSLWIDAEREIAVALLTNRTWPDNQSKLIKQVRPAFHDAIMRELLKV